MIRLVIDDYCSKCPDFEPNVDKMQYEDIRGDFLRTDTTITCENRNRCRCIYERLKKEEQ